MSDQTGPIQILPIPKLTAKDYWSMYLWGCVGGWLPTLSRVGTAMATNFDSPFPNVGGVGVVLVIFGFIGAVVARAMGNPDMKQALFAGIAGPAIIMSVVNGISEGQMKLGEIQIVGSAYAQQRVDPRTSFASPAFQGATYRQLIIDPNVIGGAPVRGAINMKISVSDREDKWWDWYSAQLSSWDGYVTITIPTTKANILFDAGVRGVAALGLPASEEDVRVGLNVTTKSSFTRDLLFAIGVPRLFEIESIAPQIDPNNPIPASQK